MAPYSIKILTVGQLSTNCYIVWDRVTLEAMIIDPGDDADYIAQILLELKVFPRFIIATHGHFDHILGVFALQSMFNIPFYIHADDIFLLQSMTKSATYYLRIPQVDPAPKNPISLVDGQAFSIGKSIFTVMTTPGHTPGSICLFENTNKVLFTGDTLFANGAVGRTDHRYSSPLTLHDSLERIFSLPNETALLSGHGEATTIGAERKHRVV